MASTKRRVRFQGVLRGNGHEATCTVAMTEVTLQGLPPAYSEREIISVSKRLPVGVYTLEVSGETTQLRYDGQNWVSANPY